MKILSVLLVLFPLVAFSQQPQPDLSNMKIERVEVSSHDVLTIRETCTMEAIGPTLGKLYGEIGKYIAEHGLQMAGPVFAIYRSSDPQKIVLEAGVPVNKTSESTDRIRAWKTVAGNAVKASFYGDYSFLPGAYPLIQKWMANEKLKQTGSPWEVYVTDPTTVKDMKDCLTEIYYPVQ